MVQLAKARRPLRDALRNATDATDLYNFAFRWFDNPASRPSDMLHLHRAISDKNKPLGVALFERAQNAGHSWADMRMAVERNVANLNAVGRQADSLEASQKAILEDLLTGDLLAGRARSFRDLAGKAVKGEFSEEAAHHLLAVDEPLRGKAAADAPRLRRPEWLTTEQQLLWAGAEWAEFGFLKDYDFYPAANMLYNWTRLGQELKLPQITRHAQELGQLAKFALELKGGKRAADYWGQVSGLEFSLLANEVQELPDALRRVVAKNPQRDELSSTLGQMGPMYERLLTEDPQTQKPYTQVVGTVVHLLSDMRTMKESGVGQDVITARVSEALKSLEEISAKHALDMNFAETAPEGTAAEQLARAKMQSFYENMNGKAMGGNARYGGGVPSYSYSKFTEKVADQLFNILGITLETPAEVARQRLNDFAQVHFGLERREGGIAVRALEDLKSAAHVELDNAVNNRKAVFAYGDTDEPVVDLGVLWLTGRASLKKFGNEDCRPTNFAVTGMVNILQARQVAALMPQLHAALGRGETAHAAQLRQKMNSIWKEKFGTLTSLFSGKIEVPEKYKITLDANGLPIPTPDAEPRPIEDHTASVRVPGPGETVEGVDVFYHQVWKQNGLVLDAAAYLAGKADIGTMGSAKPGVIERLAVGATAAPTKYSQGINDPLSLSSIVDSEPIAFGVEVNELTESQIRALLTAEVTSWTHFNDLLKNPNLLE